MGDETLSQVLTTVRIVPSVGKTEVFLGDQEISSLLQRVSVDIAAHQAPQVFLELATNVQPEAIECEAVVTLVREVPQDPAVAMLAFLENIDADELDRCILEQMGGIGEVQTYGAVCLQVMKGWASGNPNWT